MKATTAALLALASPLTLHMGHAQPEFGDINLLIVTDAHSWISSHAHADHDPLLDADYGAIASAVSHVKDAAKAAGKDVFFVNNGDHSEGSGLSDASFYTTGVHGYDLFPLVQMMPFDALTIGNHDLYLDSTVSYMQDSGFVSSWHGNYVTSNTLNASTGETIGSKYTVLTGPNDGTKIMVLGFLYHMTDSTETIVVEDPADTVQNDWFQEMLVDAQNVDAIVVLSHMDLKDDNVYVLSDAIRVALPDMPVQFVTGHTHYRGWKLVDDYSSTFEAGHYLDTLGWISFDLPTKESASTTDGSATASNEEAGSGSESGSGIWFNYEYVDANMESLYNFTGKDEASFPTEQGDQIAAAIQDTVTKLNLTDLLGCPPQSYSYSASLDADDSLYALYMDTIIPNAVFDIPTGTGNTPYHLSSTGTLRYDVYQGAFYYDDVFAVAPFANVFMYYPGISGADVAKVQAYLTSSDAHKDEVVHPRALTSSSLPYYVGGPDVVDASTMYDLFFNDYDGPYLQNAISAVLSLDVSDVQAATVGWRDDMSSDDFVDTTVCWSKNVAQIWPCDATAH